MRELLAICLIIACFTVTNGVVIQKKEHQIFNEKSYAYKICRKYPYEQNVLRCVVREDEKIEGLPLKTCRLDYEKYANTTLLSFAFKSVILTFTDGSDNKIVNVNLNNCNITEVNLDTDISKIKEMFFYDDKYYVISYGDDVCKEYYCKAVYDSNGKIVRGVDPLFNIFASSDISIKTASKGVLINEYLLDGQVKLYFAPYEGFLKPALDSKVLLSVPHGSWYGISVGEDKLGFCAFDDGKTVANSTKKIVCQQYDAEGKTKLIDSVIPIDKENHVEFVKATNYYKGLFVMVNEWVRKNDLPAKRTFLVYIDQHGQQGKHFEFDLDEKCENLEVDQFFHTMEKRNRVDYFTTLVYNCYDPFNRTNHISDLYYKVIPDDCYTHRKNLEDEKSTTALPEA